MATYHIHSKRIQCLLKIIGVFETNISMFEIKHCNEKNNLLAYFFFAIMHNYPMCRKGEI